MKTASLCAVVIVAALRVRQRRLSRDDAVARFLAPAANTSSAAPRPCAATIWSVVALGDSVPQGAACDCTPYPELSASELSQPGVREISVDNFAVGGYTTRT